MLGNLLCILGIYGECLPWCNCLCMATIPYPSRKYRGSRVFKVDSVSSHQDLITSTGTDLLGSIVKQIKYSQWTLFWWHVIYVRDQQSDPKLPGAFQMPTDGSGGAWTQHSPGDDPISAGTALQSVLLHILTNQIQFCYRLKSSLLEENYSRTRKECNLKSTANKNIGF